jgi:hypothetical protein
MDKDRLMGQAQNETAQNSNPNGSISATRTYDELGRPMTVFRRVLRWFRKIFKGY